MVKAARVENYSRDVVSRTIRDATTGHVVRSGGAGGHRLAHCEPGNALLLAD